MKRILKWTALILVVGLFAWFQFSYWTSTNDCDRLAATQGETMKAVVYCEYGGPEVLKLMEIAKPVPTDDQVLIKVRAVSVNPYDWHFMRGEPYVMRLGNGLRKPQGTRLGVDFAGTVEAVGKNITQFKPGDDVYGGR
ncbi:MAG TPA: alcohol dehydrogenase catalytic domain-containing protein, partial [Chthoniobacterales bacterium]